MKIRPVAWAGLGMALGFGLAVSLVAVLTGAVFADGVTVVPASDIVVSLRARATAGAPRGSGESAVVEAQAGPSMPDDPLQLLIARQADLRDDLLTTLERARSRATDPSEARTPTPRPLGTQILTPTSQPTLVPSRTSEPTRTPEPGRTPESVRPAEPTRAPDPARTPEPARTPDPTRSGEATRTPDATDVPEPTDTPRPTRTPQPANSPQPTQTRAPTQTPQPSNTPQPTQTPQPADTRAPTQTPQLTNTPKPPNTPSPTRTGSGD